MTLSARILTSRFLTHSGDQAWDFAVPLVLLKILPGQLRLAALFYFIIRLFHFFLFPHISALIDRIGRLSILKLGLALQIVGVFFGTLCVFQLQQRFYLAFAGLIVAGILESLGSALMKVFIANDLIPSAFHAGELTNVNGRLRQMDLLTEITIPIIAGFVLLIESPTVPLLGFVLIGLWNVLSFAPEYFLLRSVFSLRPDLYKKDTHIFSTQSIPLWQRLTAGWTEFWKEKVALPVLAYALICFTVLSPHGALITGFLKDGWQLPEMQIGIFRGVGAAFGLIATFLFGWATSRLGLVRSTQTFLCFQAAMVLASLLSFWKGGVAGQFGFLAFIVFSRIGLYGFSLGEVQIRQIGIPEKVRGKINGFADALSNLPNLILYCAAALFASGDTFQYFVLASALAVTCAACVFSFWAARLTPRHTQPSVER